jgi:hypothetical protein
MGTILERKVLERLIALPILDRKPAIRRESMHVPGQDSLAQRKGAFPQS